MWKILWDGWLAAALSAIAAGLAPQTITASTVFVILASIAVHTFAFMSHR